MLTFSDAVPPFMKNAYLIACPRTREAVLVDPGDEVESMVATARQQRLDVRHVLLTHAHLDHITGVSRAKEAFVGAPVWLQREDEPLYRGVVQQGQMFGLHVEAQPPVDRFYEPGQQITVGDLTIRVHPTPGHSPGGVCLEVTHDAMSESAERSTALPQTRRVLVVGDTLFAGSIGRTDLPGGDHATLIRSIRTVLFAFPDDTPVLSGHFGETTIGRERASNPFVQ